MTDLQLALVDAFTRVPGEGNRAGVVLDAGGLDQATMQPAARAIGASETAFLVASAHGEHRLRYFTPLVEVPFCGHATVAMLHQLVEAGRVPCPGRCTIACEAGRFDAELEAVSGGCRVWLETPLYPWSDSPVDETTVLELLGGSVSMRDRGLAVRRSGPKLFVPLRRRCDLFSLQPRWEELVALAGEHGISGVLAFTRDALESGSSAHARYFAPARGVREDPVTGAALGPLAEYLAERGALPGGRDGTVRTRAEQGDAIGKPGRVDLEVTTRSGEVARVRIGGAAVTVLTGTLCSPTTPRARGGGLVP